MNFGMIPYRGLTEDMFVFPEIEQPYLSGTKNPNPQIFIGLSKWTYKEELKKMKNQVPPYGTLKYYSTVFNSVEMNNTHYAIPNKEQIATWYNSVGSDFRFCPKLSKTISHYGNIGLQKVGATNDFINSVSEFKERLGQSFIQLKETITSEAKKGIVDYLKKLPSDFNLSVELRNENWFSDKAFFEDFVKELSRMNKGLVICDTPGRRDAVHMQLSNATAFIRFVCHGGEALDMFRIEQWRKQLKSWYLQGLEKCYFFLHIHDGNSEDDFIKYVQSELKF